MIMKTIARCMNPETGVKGRGNTPSSNYNPTLVSSSSFFLISVIKISLYYNPTTGVIIIIVIILSHILMTTFVFIKTSSNYNPT